MKQVKNHPYHLVDIRPWPLLSSIRAFTIIIGLIKWFHLYDTNLLLIGVLINSLVIYQWWRDITRERTYQGLHTIKVTIGLRWGIILFITSEVFFFLAFFWRFLHSSLSPRIELGLNWPPKGIKTFNPLEIPFLNTLILLSSGLTVTWTHHRVIENDFDNSVKSLSLTGLIGILFTILQAFEYKESQFTIADGIYGSTFFITTGLHGIHVIIGSIFLLICLTRLLLNHFTSSHHFGFEAAAWYWHFVDVVWLFLYILIYWWGG